MLKINLNKNTHWGDWIAAEGKRKEIRLCDRIVKRFHSTNKPCNLILNNRAKKGFNKVKLTLKHGHWNWQITNITMDSNDYSFFINREILEGIFKRVKKSFRRSDKELNLYFKFQ